MRKRMTMILAAILTTCMAFAQNELVTPPDDATIEQWALTYDEYDENNKTTHMTETAQIAFVDDDVYISGIAINGAWVKGTVNGSQVVIPQGQYVGSMYNYQFFLKGYDGGEGGVDITFDYDQEKGTLTSTTDIVLATASDDIMGHITNVVISKNGGQATDITGLNAPPEGTPTETWTMTATEPDAQGNKQQYTYSANVAIVGSDMYIQNIAYEDAWVKGTISGNKVTFPAKQYVGDYQSIKLYFAGYQGGESLVDVVFSYDAAAGRMTTDQFILLVDDEGTYYGMMENVVLTKGTSAPEEEDQVVEVPNGLQTSDYLFKASSIIYDNEGNLSGMEQVEYNVRVGFQGNDVYIQGLFQGMPLAWVKGTKNADGDYVFEAGQYLGAHPVITSSKFYLAGQIFGEMSNIEMEYDSATRTLKGGSYYLLINSDKKVMAPYYVFAGVTITKIAEKAAVPADPTVTEYAAYNSQYGYGYVSFDIPVKDKDGNAIVRDKLYYKMYVKKGGQEEAYVFQPSLYKNLTSDMSLVPYLYSDGYDFMYGGTQVCFYQESDEWEQIGVQSVYSGGYVNNSSAIYWYDIKSGQQAGINDVEQDAVSTTYTDLQGRKATSSARGLVIKTQRMADGTLRSVKVLR